MTEKRVAYADFSGGDWGTLGPFSARQNMVGSLNCMLFNNQEIGPRPGLKKSTNSGISGTLRSLYYIGYPGTPKRVLFAVAGTGGDAGKVVYYSDLDSGTTITWTALSTKLDAAATQWVPVDFYDPNGAIYLSNPASKTYSIDWPTGAVAEITVAGSSRGLRTLRLFRDRLYVSNDQTSPTSSNPGHRVYYSDAADFDTIGATNYFDVGYFWDVGHAVPLNNSLMFMQRQTGWWALLGGSPITGQLRQVTSGDVYISAAQQQTQVVRANGKVWYWTLGSTLASTNGAAFDIDEFRHIYLSGTKYGIYCDQYGHVIFVSDSGNKAVIQSEGAWFPQEFGVTVTGETCATEFHDRVMIANGTTYLYSLDFSRDRPGFTSDTAAGPGDDSSTPLNAYFYLPAVPAGQGKEVRVRQVIVDFTKFNTGSATSNGITPSVRTWMRPNFSEFGNDDYVEVTDQSWSEPGSYASTSGQKDRVVFNYGQSGYGAATQVGLTALQGVTVKAVTVVYDEQDRPNR